MNHKEILNYDTVTADEASQINPMPNQVETSFDDVVEFIESFFNKAPLDMKHNFKNGKVPLIREQFDMSQFYKNLNSLIEMSYNECIEETQIKSPERDNLNILLRSIFKSIQSSNEILSTMECTQKIPHIILIKLLSYCLYSFYHYHKSYDRRKQVQEQTHNS